VVGSEEVGKASGVEDDYLPSLEPVDGARAQGEKEAEEVVGVSHQEEAEEELGARAG